jgi:hypothetical protein
LNRLKECYYGPIIENIELKAEAFMKAVEVVEIQNSFIV